jgi:hypothetical protein
MNLPSNRTFNMFKRKAAPTTRSIKYGPLTMSRSRVLGRFYARCERLDNYIPVYLKNESHEKLGVVNESDGKYSDGFTFHLSEENCKALALGKFDYSFDCQFSEPDDAAPSRSKRRLQLVAMFLTAREIIEEAVAKPENSPASL